jgi:hypothetical protein
VAGRWGQFDPVYGGTVPGGGGRQEAEVDRSGIDTHGKGCQSTSGRSTCDDTLCRNASSSDYMRLCRSNSLPRASPADCLRGLTPRML